MRPTPDEHLPYFSRYITLVPGDDIVAVLAEQVAPLQASLRSLPGERAGFRYGPGKWSVREVVGHLIDTERVFGFRALWCARGATDPLPSFEQDDFVRTAGHDQYHIAELVDEFVALRESHVLMFRQMSPAAWTRLGTVGGGALSARAAAWIMAGHVLHHTALLRERYGV